MPLTSAERSRRYVAARPERVKLGKAEYQRRRYWEMRSVINEYKTSSGCADCGFNSHPAALEFDHLPGTKKSFCVGSQFGGRSLRRVWEEVAKCEVVCANCHAIRTSARRV